MIALVLTCLELLDYLNKLKSNMDANWTTCQRLCERCSIFVVQLQRFKSNENLLTPHLQPSLQAFHLLLQDIQKYIDSFSKNSMRAIMSRAMFRQSHAEQIMKYHEQLNECAINLQVVSSIDQNERRQQDIQVMHISYILFSNL